MNIKVSHLVVSLCGAALSFYVATPDFWNASKGSLLIVLSVIAAGGLVRLARGLPFTSFDQMELDEARKISAAVSKSVAGLRMLIIAILLAMAFTIFVDSLVLKLSKPSVLGENSTQYSWKILSTLGGGLFTYIFVRFFAVINGDVGIVELQTEFLEKSVARRKAEVFEKTVQSNSKEIVKNPDDYGKLIQ